MSTFNNENITDMKNMFEGCTSLKDVNFFNINTLNVKNMRYMFCRCKSLKTIDLSSFNTENVQDMRYMIFMFQDWETLKNVEQVKTNDERIIHHFDSYKIF